MQQRHLILNAYCYSVLLCIITGNVILILTAYYITNILLCGSSPPRKIGRSTYNATRQSIMEMERATSKSRERAYRTYSIPFYTEKATTTTTTTTTTTSKQAIPQAIVRVTASIRVISPHSENLE